MISRRPSSPGLCQATLEGEYRRLSPTSRRCWVHPLSHDVSCLSPALARHHPHPWEAARL